MFTAWDDNKLVGLINAIDDGELTAYVHYLLVHPDYHGNNIGTELVNLVNQKYKNYLYIILIAENEGLVKFYKKIGFKLINDRYVLVIQNT